LTCIATYDRHRHIRKKYKHNSTHKSSAPNTVITPFLESFKAFPPRQKAASFTLDQALAKIAEPGAGA